MHHFMIMHIATLLIVAFFIFFAAQKAEGLVSLFGNVLGALLAPWRAVPYRRHVRAQLGHENGYARRRHARSLDASRRRAARGTSWQPSVAPDGCTRETGGAGTGRAEEALTGSFTLRI